MAKALKLNITKPNGKTYEIPITPIMHIPTTISSSSYIFFSKENTKFYDDVGDIWLLLELPVSYEAQYTETWRINNVAVQANFLVQTVGSKKRYSVQLYQYGQFDLRLLAPIDVTELQSADISVLTAYSTYLCYDYKSQKYCMINGVQAIEATNVSSGNPVYINLFKVHYYPEFFTNGKELKEGDVPSLGLQYTNPSNIFTKANQNIQMAQLSNPYDQFNQFNKLIEWLNNQSNVDPIPSPPKYPDDDDDPEGGDDDPTDPVPGTGDGTSDPIPIPPKPTIDVTGTGFVTMYNPDVIQIRNLAYFMWSGDFADLLKKIFRAPFDCLIGLKLIYAPIITGASQNIWLGNVESNVSAPKITEQFIDFDCGELNLSEYFGSFLDYTPYTKVTIFLPFIGYKQLNTDEVMNAKLHLVYRIDVYSGACIAFLKVTKSIKSTNLDSVLYSFDGNCAMDIPFTAGDMTRYIAAILNTAASTAGAVVSNPIPSEMPLNDGTDSTKEKSAKGLNDLGNGTANLVASKPQVQRSGSLAGANSSMGIKQPYIIIERPLQQMPSNYSNFIGVPLNMTKKLNQLSGFTVVSQVFMGSTQATDEEIKMINNLLRQGVVI